MDIWLLVHTDDLNQIIGKKFLGMNTDFDSAKQFAQNAAPSVFAEWNVAEINGIWCIEGREPDSDSMSYIGLYGLVREG